MKSNVRNPTQKTEQVGWMKVTDAARYAGVSVRTFRDWFKDGLRFCRLRSGTILLKPDWIDAYLNGFEVCETAIVEQIVGDVMADMAKLTK